MLAGDGLSGIMSGAAAGWLAVNQVPVTLSGVTLGLLPLLPTVLVGLGTVKVVADGASTARELPDLIGIVGAALGGSLLVTALSLAVVADGSAVTAVGQPDPLQAFGFTLLVQGIAIAVGIAVPSLKPVLDEFAVPATERVGARGGVIAFGVLVAGGAILVFLGIATHWGAVSAMIGDGNTFDGYLGLTVLSILYLPNMMIGAAAVSTGATAQLGSTVVDAFDVSRGAVPPLPIVAAVPESGIGGLGGFLFLIPLAAGLLLGWYTRSTEPLRHLRAVGIGAAVTAALIVAWTWLAGGQLGELGHSGVGVAIAGVYTFAWLLLAGALVVGVMWAAGGGLGRGSADDDLDSWFEDVPDEDVPDDDDADSDAVDEGPDISDEDPDASDVSDEGGEAAADDDFVAVDETETGDEDRVDSEAQSRD
nr:DUF6350 family protein [Gordonia humi]